MGIAGKDTLMEENRPLYEVLDLGFGKCKMAVAAFRRKGIFASPDPIPE